MRVLNLWEVTACLRVPVEYVLVFLAEEIGGEWVVWDRERWVDVQGEWADEGIQEVLDRFIEKYVLCLRCRLPDTRFKSKGLRCILQCQACGSKKYVEGLGQTDQFILRYPADRFRINVRGVWNINEDIQNFTSNGSIRFKYTDSDRKGNS